MPYTIEEIREMRKNMETRRMRVLIYGTKSYKYTLVDGSDYSHLRKWKWGLSNAGYVVRSSFSCGKKITIRLSRYLLNPSAGKVVDHINHNKLDNRRCNLRECSISENRANTEYVRAKSGYKCVQKYYRKWRTNIRVNGKYIWLGLFNTRAEAAKAYEIAAKKHFGQYAYLKLNEKP